MKLLTICPYKEKNNELDSMLSSFYATKSDFNDIELVSEGNVTEAFNIAHNKYPNYDYYHMTNDDVIYHTKEWDRKLIDIIEDYGHGIAYGNDLLQGKNLCTFPLISGNIVRKLGWLQLPTLNRYAGDVVWKFIGESCHCLYYLPEVIIEHKWKGCTDPGINKEDMAKFAEWLFLSHKDIEKVMEVL